MKPNPFPFDANPHDRQEALEKLAHIVDLLGDFGANDCGWLTFKQAAAFHKASQIIAKLWEELEP